MTELLPLNAYPFTSGVYKCMISFTENEAGPRSTVGRAPDS